MLKDHKLRQEMYHKLESTDDWLSDIEHVVIKESAAELTNRVIEYFTIPLSQLVYPAKSYAVALIYSQLLNEYFNIPFYQSLNDPDLLYGNDPHFVIYENAPDIYDPVYYYIHTNNLIPFNESLPQVRKTVEYFKQEFYLTPNPYFPGITDFS